MSPEAFAAVMDAQVRLWDTVVHESGVHLE
jgi:hypothetical protein